MPVHEAEAIVLRQYALSDSDRIVVLITREFGKIRAAAKGVKKPQSHFAGCLEPLSHVRIEFYAREGRDLSQIRRAELIRSYLGIKPTLKQVYAYSYFAEIANEIVQDYQVNYPLFRLLLSSMEAGEKNGVNEALVRYFETWCLKLSGLFPNYAYCSSCGKCVKDDVFFAWVEVGQARCNACAQGRGLRIGAPAAVALTLMAKLPPEQFAARPLVEDAAREIERLSQRLLAMHLEKQLKSYRILKEALQSP
ncbi:MAG TPA: DNA repair protein RecO [Acidobacteriota bacterium]|nr:DNA repair protein RecO [Acidobacteriota bacterium]